MLNFLFFLMEKIHSGAVLEKLQTTKSPAGVGVYPVGGNLRWSRGGRSGSGAVLSLTGYPIPHSLHCVEGGGRRVMHEVEPRRKKHVEGRHFNFGLFCFFSCCPTMLIIGNN